MKVNYTLPGMLPEATPAPVTESGESPAEPFGAHLQRLRVPEFTDWRAVLRLNATPPGATGIGPPPAPYGIDSRDGASQRAWWRAMLNKHTRLAEGAGQEAAPGMDADGHASLQD